MNLVAAVALAIALAFSGVHVCRHAPAPSAAANLSGCHDMGEPQSDATPDAGGAMEDCPFGAFCKACPAGFAALSADIAAASLAPAADYPSAAAATGAGFTRPPDPPPPRA
jgi:hypothetical protein